MKITLVEVALLAAAVVAWIGFRSGKLNPASRENIIYQSTGEIGLKIPDLFGGIFKSKAEKEVDEMLKVPAGPVPTKKSVVTPAQEPVLVPRGYYDLGAKPVPTGEARVIGTSGVLTSGSYRDQVR